MQQERDLEAQHAREALRYSAGRLALAVNSRLAAIEEQLAQGGGIRFGPEGFDTRGEGAPLYQPVPLHSALAPEPGFAAAEALEFQQQDASGAARVYRRLAQSDDPQVRAAALVRLGAVLRKQRDTVGALQVYARLQELGSVRVDDQPAGLIARQAQCRIYEETGDRSHLREKAAVLADALASGRLPLDRPTFLLYTDMLRHWGAATPAAEEIARTDATIALWRDWRAGELRTRGRKIVAADGIPVLAIWTGGPEHPTAWIASPPQLERGFAPLLTHEKVTVALYDPEGERLSGPDLPNAVALTPGETRLPFILRVAYAPGHRSAGEDRGRRALLLAGLALTFAVMLAAAYGLYRATAREMALARQQSDFVSTVSHEFRTPLTSMRHLTELLASGSVPNEERKATYYQLLARETERLHRMVESLLTFGRMQAGAYAWKLEEADPAAVSGGRSGGIPP